MEKRYVDQANTSCLGILILSLSSKVGAARLAAACRLAASYERYSFNEIQDILKNKFEFTKIPEETKDIPEHENIRGKDYYQ